MAAAEKMVEKVPGWVERLLIPTLESGIRSIVKEEVGNLEKTINAKFEAVNVKFEAVGARFDAVNLKFDAVDERFDSLERRIPMMQDIADLKARLAVVEKRTEG